MALECRDCLIKAKCFKEYHNCGKPPCAQKDVEAELPASDNSARDAIALVNKIESWHRSGYTAAEVCYYWNTEVAPEASRIVEAQQHP